MEARRVRSEDVTGLPSARLSEGLTEPEGSAGKVSHWVVAVGRRPVLHLGLPLGCMNVVMIWLLTSSRTGHPESKVGATMPFVIF